jgi:dTDP-4-amino-4,6-dideoxygalactose transaminase
VGELTNTDYLMLNALWLGVFPGLDEARISYMEECIGEILR